MYSTGGEARQTLPPIQEWRRFDAADVQPGCSGARKLMAAGKSPKAVLRAAEAGHQDPRAAGGREMLRRWCEALRQEYLAGLAHELFLKLLKAKREVARRRGRRPWPRRTASARCALRADGRHLRAGPRGAGKAAFGQRADFGGDCHKDAEGEPGYARSPSCSSGF